MGFHNAQICLMNVFAFMGAIMNVLNNVTFSVGQYPKIFILLLNRLFLNRMSFLTIISHNSFHWQGLVNRVWCHKETS